MAATAVTLTPVGHTTGTAPPSAQAGDNVNGMTMQNDGNVLLIVTNSDGSNPHTITFTTPSGPEGMAAPARAISIPASATRVWAKHPVAVYGAVMAITVDSASLTFIAYQQPA
jgi:hypothetical protein